MAGVIQFTLEETGGNLAARLASADQEAKSLKFSLDALNPVIAHASSGAGSSLTASDLKAKSRALGGLATNAAMNAGMLFGGEAGAAIYPVVFLSKELKGLSAAMKAAGVSVVAASGVVAAFAATAWIAAKGIEAAKAIAEEKRTAKNFDETSAMVARKLVEFINAGMKTGQVSKYFGESSIADLTEKGLHPSILRSRIKAIQAELKDVIPADQLATGTEWFNRTKRELQSQSLDGDTKRMFDANAAFAEIKSQVEANRALTKSQREELLSLAETRFQFQVRPDAVEKEAKPQKSISLTGRPQVTDWERMGFQFNGRSGGFDYAKNTADNTRQLVGEVKRTNTLLEKGAGTSNSFANQ